MDRSEWKDRLLKAGMEAELVDDILATTDDDALLRMKDMSPEEVIETLKEVVEKVANEGDPPKKEGADAGDLGTEDTDDTADIAAILKEFGDGIVERVVEHLQALEITVETPDLAEVVSQLKELKDEYAALNTTLKEMQEAWAEILKTDTERLRERLGDLSPVQRVRLQATLGDKEAMKIATQFLREKNQVGDGGEPPLPTNIFRTPMAGQGEVVIRDSEGKEYNSLGDLARGQPKS